jgi:hypothetical protein
MKVILRMGKTLVDCNLFAEEYFFRAFTGNYLGIMTRPSVNLDILTSGE